MTEYLYTTFGSEEVLQMVREANPERGLMLTVDDTDPLRYQLLDKTTAKSVFSTPTSYEILSQTGKSKEIRGWMNFTFLTISDQERANFIRRWETFQTHGFDQVDGFMSAFLLQRTDEPQQMAILTTWTLKEFWTIWDDETENPLTPYEAMASRYGLRNSQYSFAAFSKQTLD
ncbi:antibiotic biosynthesis monooxygenase family protein [Weissella tructae]|uniref:ABM domain-containing protein n=2 Tax=Weissella TaxID=46255 RepID=A0A075TYI9_9LACO|nr:MULTISPECIES: hypothetical protein [Weissella]AIG65290.1 hypothetical protein WS08_0351 [Weissella tructae]AIM62603.1 hypothetical protein WS74_0351 [Weissella ceti]AIM63939.1 hypothetical protein WS105_0349 [Weissella ceti]ELA07692.1 hypothetical protein WCNC_01775 [Weissella ceti NC36]QVV91671.1 hypothetical protein KHQ32_01985 [Weissella tructae]